MIVTCPSCRNKYSVQAEAIGEGKLVRCVACGTTWQQYAVNEPTLLRENKIIGWAFFCASVFLSFFFLVFAKNSVINIWPPAVCFYKLFEKGGLLAAAGATKETVKISNVSDFYAYKNGSLYMGIEGELQNVSNDVQTLPGISIKLSKEGVKKRSFQKIWTHDMVYQKILPSQKVSFKTKMQKVPLGNIRCDIKVAGASQIGLD